MCVCVGGCVETAGHLLTRRPCCVAPVCISHKITFFIILFYLKQLIFS